MRRRPSVPRASADRSGVRATAAAAQDVPAPALRPSGDGKTAAPAREDAATREDAAAGAEDIRSAQSIRCDF